MTAVTRRARGRAGPAGRRGRRWTWARRPLAAADGLPYLLGAAASACLAAAGAGALAGQPARLAVAAGSGRAR